MNNKPLIIFELANNHGGSLEHGFDIIHSLHSMTEGFDFDFAFKFQYRSNSYIHKSYRGKDDPPYVKRFESTRLSSEQYKTMIMQVRLFGWKAICTPFDEESVGLIESQGFDYIKIASCSLTDWPLLERIGRSSLPVIASTAGASLEDIDRVVEFLSNRGRLYGLMHCVGEYPAPGANWQLNQIDVLRDRYPGIRIGWSSHAKCGLLDSEQIAIAKGASILEIHVDDFGHHTPNAYSWTPEPIRGWLHAIKSAIEVCGVANQRHQSTEKEQADLRKFRRGVYATRDILEGETLDETNTECAYPNKDGQLVANDLPKYTRYTAKSLIVSGAPILSGNLDASDTRPLVVDAINKVRELLIAANIRVPDGTDVELSHHYGLDKFDEYGAAIINVINREYCKKLLVMLPGQKHPFHYHVKKEESFHVLHGRLTVMLESDSHEFVEGKVIIVEREEPHAFQTRDGAVFEEVSTMHFADDSFYLDDVITANNNNRKTRLKFRSSWLERPVV